MKNKRIIYRPKTVEQAMAATSIAKYYGYSECCSYAGSDAAVRFGIVFRDNGKKDFIHFPDIDLGGIEVCTIDALLSELTKPEPTDKERLDWLEAAQNF